MHVNAKKGLFRHENISITLMSISQKTLKNNTALEIALNNLASLFSFVYYVGLQWWHYLTTIQQRVGFVLLTGILKSSRPTFTF